MANPRNYGAISSSSTLFNNSISVDYYASLEPLKTFSRNCTSSLFNSRPTKSIMEIIDKIINDLVNSPLNQKQALLNELVVYENYLRNEITDFENSGKCKDPSPRTLQERFEQIKLITYPLEKKLCVERQQAKEQHQPITLMYLG